MKKKVLVSMVTILIISLFIISIAIISNLTKDIIKDFGYENLGKSFVALYQVKMDITDCVEIKEDTYLVKDRKKALDIGSSKKKTTNVGFLEDATFKMCKDRYWYSVVEFI